MGKKENDREMNEWYNELNSLAKLNLRRMIMFDDERSKKVVFIAHCLLNQNSISDGTAVYPAMFRNVIELFMKADMMTYNKFRKNKIS